MATFLTRREAQHGAKVEREQKRCEKRHWKDLWWLGTREVLDDKQIYELYKLSEKYSNYGPRQLEFELNKIMEYQEFLKRQSAKSDDPFMNALQKHLADHEVRTQAQQKQADKKIVYAHPIEKLALKNK